KVAWTGLSCRVSSQYCAYRASSCAALSWVAACGAAVGTGASATGLPAQPARAVSRAAERTRGRRVMQAPGDWLIPQHGRSALPATRSEVMGPATGLAYRDVERAAARGDSRLLALRNELPDAPPTHG